jgi:hypothetical protein
MSTEQITNMNVNVLCDKCGKSMRLTCFRWISWEFLKKGKDND